MMIGGTRTNWRRSVVVQRTLIEFQDELGPVARFGAQVTLVIAIIFMFQATGMLLPGPVSYLILAGALAAFMLAPRKVALRLPISLSVLLMIGWMIASVTWTEDPVNTNFVLLRTMPAIIGVVIIVGILDVKHLATALLWAIRIAVILSLVIVTIDPSTRVHLDVDGSISITGWHALFPHKNIMTPFLVFAIPTVLTFDRTFFLKWSVIAGTAILLVGSDSVTGLFSAGLVVGIWVWLQFFRNFDVRNSSVFAMATLTFGLFTVAGAVASLASIVDASGKDVTFSGRTFIWQATINATAEQPLQGYGLGGVFGLQPITPRTAAIWRDIGFPVPHAHNGILDILVQLGIIGAVLFSLLWVSVLVGSIRMLKTNPEIAEWMLSVTLAQLFISLSENVFLGSGWLLVIVMFRLLLLRKRGLSLGYRQELPTEDVGRPSITVTRSLPG